MGVIKRSNTSTKHDDSKSNMGVSSTQEAINKLDERLDTIENAGGGVPGFITIPIQLYTKRTNITANNQAGWIDMGNNVEVLTFADGKNQSISTQLTLGENYKAGDDLFFKLNWLPLSASTGNVVMFMDYISGNNPGTGEVMNTATTRKEFIVSGNGTDAEYLVMALEGTDEFGNDLKPGSTIAFTLTRAGLDSRDTFYGSISMLSAYFYHKDGSTDNL